MGRAKGATYEMDAPIDTEHCRSEHLNVFFAGRERKYTVAGGRNQELSLGEVPGNCMVRQTYGTKKVR